LHFFAFPATFLRHLFAAMLKALRACFAVLIFEPLSFAIRHFLNPGFTRVDRALRLLTMCLCPGEERATHRPLSLWHIHVTSLHRLLYLFPIYKNVCQILFEKMVYSPILFRGEHPSVIVHPFTEFADRYRNPKIFHRFHRSRFINCFPVVHPHVLYPQVFWHHQGIPDIHSWFSTRRAYTRIHLY